MPRISRSHRTRVRRSMPAPGATTPSATTPSATTPIEWERDRPARRVTGGQTARIDTESKGAPADARRPLALRLEARAGRRRSMGKDPLRAHVRIGGKLVQVPFEETFAARAFPPPGPYRAVGAAELARVCAAAQAARTAALGDLENDAAAPMVTPEDGSRRIVAYHMGFGAMDQAAERFVEQMADIGRVEGFRVVVRVAKANEKYLRKLLDAEEERNVTCVVAETYHDIWSEDAGEIREDRSVSVPASMPAGMSAPAEIIQARIERFTDQQAPATNDTAKLFALLKKRAPAACFGVLGRVFEREAQQSMAALAASSGRPLRVSPSAIEGGNLLVGTNHSGDVVAFVGRDSFELTRRVLQRETGRMLTDDEVRGAIAKDLGVPAARVHPIEQPGDYHLDVKMLPVAPGEMIVNDSLAAAELSERWLRDDWAARAPDERGRKQELEERIKGLRAAATLAAQGEALAQRDLENAGMAVHRVAAVFPWTASVSPMNFLNAEQGRGKDGKRFLIALGGEPRGEQHFLGALKQIASADIERVYFLDREFTHATLQAGGGVNCRAKPEQG